MLNQYGLYILLDNRYGCVCGCMAVNMVIYIVVYVVVNMAVYKLCKKLNFITIYNAYILNSMVFVVFFTVEGQQLWNMVALVGNRYKMYFMSPSNEITVGNEAFKVRVRKNTVAVVLDTMSKEEMASLKKALLDAFLFVVPVSEDNLAQWMHGSDIRIANFLKGSSFVLPLCDQFHLVLPLCNHARVDPNILPGVVSIANAQLAAKHALCYVLWGATSAWDALTNM